MSSGRTIQRTLPTPGKRRWQTSTHRWVRWVHVYTSMISLLIVLFFGITGITLNHPTWTFGDGTDRSSFTGTLPAGVTDAERTDFLAASEFIRDTYGISADVADHGITGDQGTIAYKGPGYAADLFFDVDTGAYELAIEQQGLVAVLNDLHKGRDTASSWNWAIDVAGGFLVLVATTGLGIQLFLRKRRARALAMAAGGAGLAVLLMVLTTT